MGINVEMPDGTIIQDVPEGVSQEELTRRLQSLKQASPVGGLMVGTGQNPDQYAQARKDGQQLGVPAELVSGNLDLMGQADLERKLNSVEGKPTLSAFVGDPNNAAVAHDDLKPLGTIETALQKAGDLWTSFKSGASKGAVGDPLIGVAAGYDAATRSLGRALGPVGDALNSVQIPWFLNPGSLMRKGGETVNELDAMTGTVPKERQGFDTEVAQGVGQLVSQVAMAIATAPATAGKVLMGMMLAGGGMLQQAEKTKAAGAEGPVADLSILAGGVITGLTEKYGLDMILNRVPPAIKNGLLRGVADISIATTVEAAQEIAENLLHNLLAKVAYNPNQDWKEGAIDEAMTAGTAAGIVRSVVVGALGGRRFAQMRVEQERTDQVRAVFDALAQGSQNSKLRGRLPEAFRDFIDKATADGPVSTVYMPADRFVELFQSAGMNPAQVAESLPGVGNAALTEAVARNGELEIPMSSFAAHMTEAKIYSLIAKDIKLSPDQLTQNQLEDMMNDPKFKEVVDRLVKANTQRNENVVYNDIYSQFISSGRTEAEADNNAKTWASRMAARAAERGMSVADLWKEERIQIIGPQAQELRQVGDLDVILERMRSQIADEQAQAQLDPQAADYSTADLKRELDAMAEDDPNREALQKEIDLRTRRKRPTEGKFENAAKELRSILEGRGIDPATVDAQTAQGVLDNILGNVQVTTDGAEFEQNALDGMDNRNEDRVSTRIPTSKKQTFDPHSMDNLVIDMQAIRDGGKMFDKMMELARNYTGLRFTPGMTNEAMAAEFIRHVSGNLRALYFSMPADMRERAKLWYDGANRLAMEWSQTYDLEPRTVAGVMASLSPQMDWFKNVSLAKRMLDIWTTKQDHVFDPKMEQWIDGKITKFNNKVAKQQAKLKKLEKEAKAQRKIAKDKTAADDVRQAARDRLAKIEKEKAGAEKKIKSANRAKGKWVAYNETIRGLTLRQVGEAGDDKAILHQAVWTRVYDEAHHDKSFPIVTPEGKFGANQTNMPDKKGRVKETSISWGSFEEIGSAVAILRNPSMANISVWLGANHKVRNFYNNIIAPNGNFGDVTIDTHAIAAALFRPLAGSHIEVEHGLGLSGSASAETGAKGIYGLYADAYRAVAADLGILPRELQSITWEAIRGLFSAEDKRNDTIEAAVNEAWHGYQQGLIDEREARQRIVAAAASFQPPDWAGSGAATYGLNENPDDAGGIRGDSLRRGAGGLDAGTDRQLPGGSGVDLNQSAWHGSPHIFSNFDLSKIGTGEGNQAYGWGLYFASLKEIAQHYRDALSQDVLELPSGNKVPARTLGDMDKIPGIIRDELEKAGIDTSISESARRYTYGDIADIISDALGNTDSIDAALAELRDKAETVRDRLLSTYVANNEAIATEKAYAKAADALQSLIGKGMKNGKGRLYKVEIPDDGQYLLWDKPLSEQPEAVKKALASMGIKYDADAMRAHDDALLAALEGDANTKLPPMPKDPKGEGIYLSLTSSLGSGGRDVEGKKAASLALRDAGIAGIKYLDGTSRNLSQLQSDLDAANDRLKNQETGLDVAEKKGDKAKAADWKQKIEKTKAQIAGLEQKVKSGGTFNYVLFDDSAVQIVDYEQSAGFERWREGLPLVDQYNSKDYQGGGAVFSVFHGTTHNDITKINPRPKTGSTEGALGAGFYTTTSPEDASSNYAGEGPDLTGRLQQEKEQIADIFEDERATEDMMVEFFDEDEQARKDAADLVDVPELFDFVDLSEDKKQRLIDKFGDDALGLMARQRLKGKSDGLVMPVYVKLKKPFDIRPNGLQLELNQEYDENEEPVGDPTGSAMDLIEALQSNGEAYGVDVSDLVTYIYDYAMGDSISAYDVWTKASSTLGESYNDDGDLNSTGEFMQQVARDAGYDGIVMDADLAFGSGRRGFGGARVPGMAGVNPGTLHVMPFDGRQVKSSLGNNGDFDPNSSNILQQGEARGSVRFTDFGALVKLGKSADRSTFLHESGHIYLEQLLADLSDSRLTPEARARIEKDVATVWAWFAANSKSAYAELKATLANTAPGTARHALLTQALMVVDSAGGADGMKLFAQTMGSNITDPALRAAIMIPFHEMWARSYEQYLFEGKAPSQELQGAFARFSLWLKKIYGEVKAIGGMLTDDIRSVMDRMVAAHDAIDKSSAAYQIPPELFENLTPAEQTKLRQAMAQVDEDAKAELTRKLLTEVDRQKKAEWKEEYAKVEAEKQAEVEQRPVYQALALMREGGQKLSRDRLVADFGPEILKHLPRGITVKEGGIELDDLAGQLGYTSGDALRLELMNLRPMNEVVKELTDAEMKARHGDLMDNIAEEAVSAVENSKTKLIELQLTMLRRLAGGLLKKGAERAARADGVTSTAVEDKAAVTDATLEGQLNDKATPADLAAQVKAEQTKSANTAERTAQKKDRAKVLSILRNMDLAAIKLAAQKIIAAKQVKDLSPSTYRATADKLARKAMLAIAERDYEAATALKEQQLLNIYMAREAEREKKKIDKALTKFGKLHKSDKKLSNVTDIDFVYAARAVLSQYNIVGADYAFDFDRWVKLLAETDLPKAREILDLIAGMTVRPRDYKVLTVDQFRDLADLADALLIMGRNAKSIEIGDKRIARQEAVGELVAQMADQPARKVPTDKEKRERQAGIMGIISRLRRVEHWTRMMDGGKSGPFNTYIVQPVMDALVVYRDAKAEQVRKLRDIVKPIQKGLLKGPIAAPELGAGFTFNTKAELLHAILHTGNEGNMKRLILGYKWGVPQADGVDRRQWDAFMARMYASKTITKEDMDAVQKIWDLLESTKGAVQRAHKKMKGYYFKEVEAWPVLTPFGTYRGGYVPAIYSSENPDRGKMKDAESLMEGQNAAMFPSVARGFTKGRAEDYSGELELDMMLLAVHLDKVMRFAHLGPAIQTVASVVNDREFRGNLHAVDVTAVDEMIWPWLQRTAQQSVYTPMTGEGGRRLDRFFNGLRGRVGLHTMALNVVNAAQQIASIPAAGVVVGYGRLLQALAAVSASPFKMAADISAQSDFMRQRLDDSQRDIQRELMYALKHQNILQKSNEVAGKYGYILQQTVQNYVDKSVWLAAYNKAAATMPHDLAVAEADSVVRRTQGSFNPEDLSLAETGSAGVRLFTMFSGFFNTNLNLVASEAKIAKQTMKGVRRGARYLHLYIGLIMIQAVVAEAMAKGFKGELGDEDEDGFIIDDLLKLFFVSQIKFLAAMVPFAGQGISAGINMVQNDKPFDDKISPSPVVSAAEAVLRSTLGPAHDLVAKDATTAWEKMGSSRYVKDVLTTIALITGIPLGQVGKSAGYILDVKEGKQTPQNGLDVVQGLVSGFDGSQKK